MTDYSRTRTEQKRGREKVNYTIKDLTPKLYQFDPHFKFHGFH